MSKKKTYLVTGGTGFIGSAIVRRLVKDGYGVRVFDNDSRGVSSRLSDIMDRIDLVQGDIRSAEAVDQACKGMDGVFHLAFVNGTEFFYSKPDLVLDVGVKGMVHVLDACIKHNIKELILASSSEVYQTPPVVPTDESAPMAIPDPLNPRYCYAAGKIISEIMTINYGRKHFDRVLIFRPHNVYGPDMGWEHVLPQFILKMKALCDKQGGEIQFPIQGSGLETRAFVYIDDFVDGVMHMFERGDHLGIYHIGTTEEVAIGEVAKMVGAYFDRSVQLIQSAPTPGGTPRRCPDIRKLGLLGYKPQISLKQGIPLIAKWYADNARLAPVKN